MISYTAMSHYREMMEDCGAPTVVMLGEHRRTVRKPRHLSCGGDAQVGWVIIQAVYIVDGEFTCDERCQRCDAAEHGYEIDGPAHGNITVT